MRIFFAFITLLFASVASAADTLTLTRIGNTNTFNYSLSLPASVNAGTAPHFVGSLGYYCEWAFCNDEPKTYYPEFSTVAYTGWSWQASFVSSGVPTLHTGTITIPAGKRLKALTRTLRNLDGGLRDELDVKLYDYPALCTPQTITIDNTEPVLLAYGQPVTVTPSGGHTAYDYDAPSAVDVVRSGGSFICTPNASGIFVVKFYAVASAPGATPSYCQSVIEDLILMVGEQLYCVKNLQVAGPQWNDATGKRGTLYKYRIMNGTESLAECTVAEAATPLTQNSSGLPIYNVDYGTLNVSNLSSAAPLRLELCVKYAMKWNTDSQSWVYFQNDEDVWTLSQMVYPTLCGDDPLDTPLTITPGEGDAPAPPPPDVEGGTDGTGDGATPPPVNSPGGNDKGGGTVWSKPAAPGPLEGTTYQEGVTKLESQLQKINNVLDKIEKKTDSGGGGSIIQVDVDNGALTDALTGTGTVGDLAPESEDVDTSAIQGAHNTIMGVVDGLPQPPQILSPVTEVSSFASPAFRVNGQDYSATIDFAPYATQVAVFRLIAQGVISILFFFAFVNTIRGAFAG